MSAHETARMLLQRIMVGLLAGLGGVCNWSTDWCGGLDQAAGAMEEQQVTKLARKLTGEGCS